ncbi:MULTISPECIES: hypothetical protein [Variovorax]|jgi:hypothetical protein|uniref:hypothetical protein n=1 Tax=Variovorax TaxID=34072 RepID=UPI000B154FBC|nr:MULTISPECIES: hypothetical protein [Variovorax]MBN8758699.1 hypothetical protein [Variovorax sp.]UKI07666.1 hypothetical protein L3V85_33530 [Variovorax paradoxus]
MQMKKWEAAGVVAERDSFDIDIDSAKPTRPPNVRYRDDATSPSGPKTTLPSPQSSHSGAP